VRTVIAGITVRTVIAAISCPVDQKYLPGLGPLPGPDHCELPW
jgi:hypothetical protein